ncbi:MAG: hypothetical protein RL106_558 [Bacteroidota bacterium]|jgi:hypothetical protein
MEWIRKNWWWIYSLVSGVAMVFYLSAWATLCRTIGDLKQIPFEIIAMGALSSALFYMILRWPKQHRSSPYRFATLYGAILSAGAYVVQCHQIRSIEFSIWPWVLLVFALILAMIYAPGSLVKKWDGGIRKFYLAKTFAVAWCWTVWALLPLLFIQAPKIEVLFLISFLLIAGMVIITDALDSEERTPFLAKKYNWISVVLLLIIFSEAMLKYGFGHHIMPFGLLLSAIPAIVFSQTKFRLLAAFLVDFGLVMWYMFLNWNAFVQTLP